VFSVQCSVFSVQCSVLRVQGSRQSCTARKRIAPVCSRLDWLGVVGWGSGFQNPGRPVGKASPFASVVLLVECSAFKILDAGFVVCLDYRF
jgi:hypothetical protein